MTINLRHLALKACEEIFHKGVFIGEALNLVQESHDLNKQSRAFINRLVSGTVENTIRIDYVLNQFSKVKTTKMKKTILYILRLSVYQLLFMDHVPSHAVCHEAVKLTKKRKFGNLSGFVNGVLRSIDREKDNISYPSEKDSLAYLSVYYSFPEWLITYLLSQYSYDSIKGILEDSHQFPKISIRVNPLRCDMEKLKEALSKEDVDYEAGTVLPYSLRIHKVNTVKDLKAFQKGYFQVQDESSMLVGHIAKPKKDWIIMDVCAAPGGKTTHVATMMENTGLVYSRDISEKKLNKIKENCNRLGLTNVKIEQFDATKLDESKKECADLVLADVPCSGLGIIRKKPDIKYNISEEGIRSLITIQRQIMQVSSQYVKKGGYFIYSTCTINKKENNENVAWFLENNQEFELVDLEDELTNIENATNDLGVQLLPINGQSDGFYIAKLKRKLS